MFEKIMLVRHVIDIMETLFDLKLLLRFRLDRNLYRIAQKAF
jgi:hypothetical protein